MHSYLLTAALAVLTLGTAQPTQAQTRHTYSLDQWLFSRDSSHWQPVSVPHDWAISGPFDKKWDLQMVAIEQNGETEKTEKSGRSGALPWIGRGYYTTTLTLPRLHKQRAELHFDGAMAQPVVYVNGQRAGGWAYGYTPFRVDATPFLHEGTNTITVSLNNREESSRWYPGAGLYRPVTLSLQPAKMRLDAWHTSVTTTDIYAHGARLHVSAAIQDFVPTQGLTATVRISDGHQTLRVPARVSGQGMLEADLTLPEAQLWSPETPHLYDVEVSLHSGRRQLDRLVMRTGIRTVSVSREHGFRLNGVSRKIHGVCLHHDLGPLGAAVSKAALIRQVRQLKDMGADAIRTSHNLPSQMQMEVYDSLGMMVMAESFDMWRYPKCRNGYATLFDEWADRDLTALVRANRNHPSLIMWSIGNEIPEQWSEEGRQISSHLQELCHRLDASRPVTQGMDKAEEALRSGFAQVMDVPGFNYRVYKYDRNMEQLPQGFLLGSETASTVSSRGVYRFPLRWGVAEAHADGQCSSYDTEWCSWSNLPEEDFMAEQDKPYDIGQFVWTGYDYLGEPTPYDEYWPSRSSYFGIMDLAGLPKDRYYLYRSVWNRQQPTLHVLPHWTWPGREGEVTPVFVYTSYPEAELWINGRSMGRRRKAEGLRVPDRQPSTPDVARQRATRYRLMWDDVRYEPGELRVVAYDHEGHAAAQQTLHTAGAPSQIHLEADRTELSADGQDLAYITVELTDAQGTPLPSASDLISVNVSGAGRLRALCNGDATSLESFTGQQMHLFSGKLVITVQATRQTGEMLVDVSCPALGLRQTMCIDVSASPGR